MISLLYIVDIDGTLADDRQRKLRAGKEPQRSNKSEYLQWLAAIQNPISLLNDATVPGMRRLLEGLTLHKMGSQEFPHIVYLTAREEKWRDVTCQWLTEKGFPKAPLLMRPDNNWESTRILKEFFIKELLPTCSQAIAIDDDGSGDCSEMYNELGIGHLHVRLPPLPKTPLEKLRKEKREEGR